MINKWSKDGNRCFSVQFDKLTWYNLFRKKSTDSVKGVSSFYEMNLWILGFKFTYTDVNYDNIVFIEIKPEDNYTKDKNFKEVKILKETLKTWIDTNTYMNQHPAFNWNFYVKDNNEYIYFLTGPKQWFINNGLECLVNSLREITFNSDEEIYFPKYNPYNTNVVNRITTYWSDENID